MDALLIVIIVAAIASLACWLLSLITRDTSWVDRAWSIVPVVYVWTFVAGAFAAWGARLTYNFARKGGYSGMEDYRWAILRRRMRPWQFQVFNAVFIIGYQMTLLVLITLPASIAAQNPSALTGWDAVFVIAFVCFLVGETVADQQQWRFHQRKKDAGGALAPGFATGGLFRYSRHPNFFFEQAQWWAFYAVGATAAMAGGAGILGGALNPTIIGPALLTVLFIGSTIFTESITASKYPAYAEYRRTTSMLVPWPPRARAAVTQA
jgi:steroid 5-alpha reductase family enzyme